MNQYLSLARQIIAHGKDKPSRPGVDTRSAFALHFRHNMDLGFPLLTTKEVNFHAVKAELLWFLRGESHVEWLHQQGVKIWDHWVDYEKDSRGHVGPIYGCQWRRWFDWETEEEIDQIQNVIDTLKRNPYDRRMIVNAWNPSDIPFMALPPCHMIFQFVYDGSRLNLFMYQRSADWCIGVPFNIASYALLLCMVCKVVGMQPGELAITFGDAHVYRDHFDGLKTQFSRKPKELPSLVIHRTGEFGIDDIEMGDIDLLDYYPDRKIKFPVAV